MAYTRRAEESVVSRLSDRARRYDKQYRTAPELLQAAIRSALPWGMRVGRGQVPPVDVLENLTAQLFAILVATEESMLKTQEDPAPLEQ